MSATSGQVDASVGDEEPAAPDDMEFRLLGPLEIRAHGKTFHISGNRRRIVLLMLLLEPGRLITVDRLIRAIWDDSPPKTAETQVQICVSQLRSLLTQVYDVDLIHTRSAGYLILLPDGAIDVVRFRQLTASGRAAAARGEVAKAATELRAALDLWRGQAATGVRSRIVTAAALLLDEERLAVLQEWIDLELELGRHQDHIGELSALVEAYPLREKLHAQLGLALYRADRQAEALAACRRARRILVDEHGIDPGAELQGMERAILTNDPTLDVPARQQLAIGPRQLPAPPPVFVGRSATVSELSSYLASPDPPGRPRDSVPVVSISGAAGVGKSVLAVHLAYQVQDAFPDGQLYAHVRGTDAMPVPPEQVLTQFLRALGVPPAALPRDLAALAALYRSRLADHRILVVLDDAVKESQVRPLVPGDPHCALVVTSRHDLPGLPGARRINVEVLEPDASLALLTRVIGRPRVEAEPTAAAALADACGHLPLALHVAAAKLSVKSHWRVAQLVRRLGDERRRLDELTLDDVGVRPSISISYRYLGAPAARLLLLLGTLGTSDFAGWVASPLLDLEAEAAADVLDELIAARLVEVVTGAGHHARYRLHDLTRIFARERMAEEVPAAERAAAQQRVLRCWLFLARRAHRREHGGDYLILHSDVADYPLPPDLLDELQADSLQWLQREYTNLVAAVSLAGQLGLDDLCWDLAVTAVTLFETRAYYGAWRETHEIAMNAVRRAGNARGEAVLRYSRGGLAVAELQLEEALQDLNLALAYFAEVGDWHGHGLVLRDLAAIDRIREDYEQALTRFEQALAELRSVGDRVAEAYVLRNLAQVHLECGRTDEAEVRLRQAMAICADVGVRRIGAQVEYRLGHVLFTRGQLDSAEATFRSVLRVVEHSNDVVGVANALLGLGEVQIERNQPELAQPLLERALAAARRSGSRLAEGQALLALTELGHRRGDPPAIAELDAADKIFAEIGASRWQSRVAELRRAVAS